MKTIKHSFNFSDDFVPMDRILKDLNSNKNPKSEKKQIVEKFIVVNGVECF